MRFIILKVDNLRLFKLHSAFNRDGTKVQPTMFGSVGYPLANQFIYLVHMCHSSCILLGSVTIEVQRDSCGERS